MVSLGGYCMIMVRNREKVALEARLEDTTAGKPRYLGKVLCFNVFSQFFV